MKVVDPGHVYKLDEVDGNFRQELCFVKRVGVAYPGNKGEPHAGVQTQEVLRALIDRMAYVEGQKHHHYNRLVLNHLRQSIYILEQRVRDERDQEPLAYDETREIELKPTCPTCGHILCLNH